jgi:hypothetical protein
LIEEIQSPIHYEVLPLADMADPATLLGKQK